MNPSSLLWKFGSVQGLISLCHKMKPLKSFLNLSPIINIRTANCPLPIINGYNRIFLLYLHLALNHVIRSCKFCFLSWLNRPISYSCTEGSQEI